MKKTNNNAYDWTEINYDDLPFGNFFLKNWTVPIQKM